MKPGPGERHVGSGLHPLQLRVRKPSWLLSSVTENYPRSLPKVNPKGMPRGLRRQRGLREDCGITLSLGQLLGPAVCNPAKIKAAWPETADVIPVRAYEMQDGHQWSVASIRQGPGGADRCAQYLANPTTSANVGSTSVQLTTNAHADIFDRRLSECPPSFGSWA